MADTKPVLISGDADLPINQFRPIVCVWSDHRWRCLLLGNKLLPHFRCTLTFRNHVPVRIQGSASFDVCVLIDRLLT